MKFLYFIYLTVISISLNAQIINIKLNIKDLSENTTLIMKPSFPEYYYESPIEDSLSNSLNSKISMDKTYFYYPYYFSYKIDDNLWNNSKKIFIKNKNLNLRLNNISADFDGDIPERKEYDLFFKEYLKEEEKYNNFHGEMFVKYNFNFPKKVEDSINNWYKINWITEMKLLDKYISSHPKSEIALWRLIEKFESNKSYNYDSFLNKFHIDLKQSFPYKMLIKKIEENKMYDIGKVFPKISKLKNIENNFYYSDYSKQKYTLIDFWFHSCKPCLLSFPDLKIIYDEYNTKGFELIGISIDNTKYVQKWIETVQKFELKWVNILDENKDFAKKVQISAVPTNFLIDQNGKIIKKNISSEDLRIFLNSELN